ncbi:MAG: hypothetical protein BMS9Abin04_123 [Planctomycetia bacterium]|nr:MAG: hypothetical protein BMS9Abin04_123 [Planctomycetia bacterium]
MISSQDKTSASGSASGRPETGSVPRILVVGDVMVDHYVWGTSDRISPEAPVPVVDVAREITTLGGAGNVVNNLLALGARVAVASVVGDDPIGREIVQLLQRRAVPTAAVVREPNRESTRKLRVMVNRQLVVRLDRESRHPIAAETETALLKALEAWRGQIDAVLLSDYDKGVLTARMAQSVVAWARQQDLPVLVDPKGADAARYRGATVLKPNRKEAPR